LPFEVFDFAHSAVFSGYTSHQSAAC
jgi:hypothetical protein